MKPSHTALPLLLLSALLGGCTTSTTPQTTEEVLRAAAAKSSVTDLNVAARSDGPSGMVRACCLLTAM